MADRSLPMAWRIGVAALFLVTATGVASSRAAGEPEPAKGDVKAVTLDDPAYPVLRHLEAAGLVSGISAAKLSDATPETLEELARIVWSVQVDLADSLTGLDDASPRRPPVEVEPQILKRRREVVRDPVRFRKLLAWYEPLVAELEPALAARGIGSNRTAALTQRLRRWYEDAPTFAQRARRRYGEGEPPAKASPFMDLPVEHPAYTVVSRLDDTGVVTGFPKHTFSGKRVLVPYEFAVAVQRMQRDLKRVLTAPEPGKVGKSVRGVLRRVRDPVGPPDRLRAGLQNPAELCRVLAWQRALVVEFAAELAMLDEHPPTVLQEIDRWTDKARSSTGKAPETQ